MTFPYKINTGIPFGTNNPADDVTPMRTNYANINGYLSVDHITPGSSGLGGNAGFHKQVTYNTENIPLATPTDPSSIAFTANATSLSTQVVVPPATTQAQNFFQNSNGIFPLTAIRAFVLFSPGASPTILNGFNITSITSVFVSGNTYTYTINLLDNSVSSVNYLVINTSGNYGTVTTGSFKLSSSSTSNIPIVILQI